MYFFNFFIYTALGISLFFNGNAQSLPDTTIHLEGLVVNGIALDQYAIGTKLQRIDNKSIIGQGSSSLQNIIQENSPIFFLQYGTNGQLSSINMRGLGPSRTSLMWNGMEINSLTLGQSDFNLIPASLFDDISIHYGPQGSLFGNGSLGGTVLLNNNLKRKNTNELSFNQSIGSFDNYRSSINFLNGKGKFKLATNVYFQEIKNDFPYKLADSTVNQQNAGYENYGIKQDIFYKIDDDNTLSFSGWFNYNYREIQPNKNDLTNDDNLEDTNWRGSLTWNFQKNAKHIETTLGYTDDTNIFNGFSKVQTKRFFYSSTYNHNLSGNVSLYGGLNWNHIRASSSNFDGKISEDRNDLFVGIKYLPISNLHLSLNARQPMLDGRPQRFSPSLGLEYFIIDDQDLNLSFLGQLSRSFRLPTLNDRFWNPGGNESLSPEIGDNYEIGMHFSSTFNKSSLDIHSNYYHHLVSDWIIWRPGGTGEDNNGNPTSFWFPDNIREVQAQGAEISVTFKRTGILNTLTFESFLSTAYTKAVNLKPLGQFDRSVGKQLPYTPQWNLNYTNRLSFNGWRFGIHYNHTGQRFTETNNERPALPAFSLVNISMDKTMEFNKTGFVASFRINNLLNMSYESFENRAMPGFNYELTITLNYKY
ncbi:MAG TPA: TonB-dependent receptor [Cyclobacteriaceae bacterium]